MLRGVLFILPASHLARAAPISAQAQHDLRDYVLKRSHPDEHAGASVPFPPPYADGYNVRLALGPLLPTSVMPLSVPTSLSPHLSACARRLCAQTRSTRTATVATRSARGARFAKLSGGLTGNTARLPVSVLFPTVLTVSALHRYPWDVSYHNRGRCLEYPPLGGACEPAFEGTSSFPRKADGGWYRRPTFCNPAAHICTGDEIEVLPPTCVERRRPLVCMSTVAGGCAGRPSKDACSNGEFCFCPPAEDVPDFVGSDSPCYPGPDWKPGSGVAPETNRVTREKLQQCASVVVSFNGPNFAFAKHDAESGHPGTYTSLPNDDIEAGHVAALKKIAMEHGQGFAPSAQDILKRLWPYPICGEPDAKDGHCTTFPVPVPQRDNEWRHITLGLSLAASSPPPLPPHPCPLWHIKPYVAHRAAEASPATAFRPMALSSRARI